MNFTTKNSAVACQFTMTILPSCFTRLPALLALALFLSQALAAQAQKVVVKDEQISVDGQPYAQLVRSGRGAVKDFSLRSRQGTEVLFAKASILGSPPNESVRYTLTFQPSGQQVTLERRGLNFGRQLAELVVANQLLTADGQPNPAGEQRFVQLYGGSVPGPRPSEQGATSPAVLASGQAQLPLERQGNVLVRAGQRVASLATEDKAGASGLRRHIHLRQPDGRGVIAEASFESLTASSCRVVTFRDKLVHTLAVPATDADAGLQIAQYLAGLGYL